MVTVFLTRKQYDTLVECFKADKEMYVAYCDTERQWSTYGVTVHTDNVQLLQCIDMVGGKILGNLSLES